MPRPKLPDETIFETFRLINKTDLTAQEATEHLGYDRKTYFRRIKNVNSDALVHYLIDNGVSQDDATHMLDHSKAGKVVCPKETDANSRDAPIEQEEHHEPTTAKQYIDKKEPTSSFSKFDIQRMINTAIEGKLATLPEIKQINDANQRLQDENKHLRITFYRFMMIYAKISVEEPDDSFYSTMADKFKSIIIGLLDSFDTSDIVSMFGEDLYPCFLFTDDKKDQDLKTVSYDKIKKFSSRLKRECPGLYDTILRKLS